MRLTQWLGDTLTSAAQNDPVNQVVQHLDDWTGSIYNQSQQIWQREDSAYQRMVEDMKKAGLNPWTGVSSGGLSTGSTNPSLDSLTGLLSVLNTSISNKNMYFNGYNFASNGLYKMGSLMTKVVDAIGNVIGAVGKL